LRNTSAICGVLVGVAVLLLVLVPACSGAPSSSRPTDSEPRSPLPLATLAPISGDRAAGGSRSRVTVYSALSDAANRSIVEAFEKAQPVIAVDILSLAAAGELQQRISAERGSPQADVFLGGSSEYHDPLGKDELLEAYRSPRTAAIDTSLRDPNGFWTGWYLGVFGMVINTERWDREMAGNVKPAAWDDLLNPALAGEVVMPDPLTTGGGYIFLANQVFRFGRAEGRTYDYMKRLDANIGQYTATSPETIDLVGRGDFLVGLNWGHDVVTAGHSGLPVEFIAPEDTAFEVGAVSIIRGGPNTVAARVFTDWVLSLECAQLIVKLSNRMSVLKGVEPAPGAPTLDSVKLVDYDRDWAAVNKDRLLQKWLLAVGR
jgi:iron(III) transport system substrate-binding protein